MPSYFFVLRETCWEGTIDHINIISPTPTLDKVALFLIIIQVVCVQVAMYFTTRLLVNSKSAIIYSTAEQ